MFPLAHHPCPNRAESMISDLIRVIGSNLNNYHGKWDVHIQKFALCFCFIVNETT